MTTPELAVLRVTPAFERAQALRWPFIYQTFLHGLKMAGQKKVEEDVAFGAMRFLIERGYVSAVPGTRKHGIIQNLYQRTPEGERALADAQLAEKEVVV